MSDNAQQPLTVRDRGDRRVARTRTAIVNALTALATEKPLRQATITELVDRAEIGRSTFYDHFASVDGVLCWLVDELIDEMGGTSGDLKVDELLRFVGSLPDVSRAFLEIETCAERCRCALADALPQDDAHARRFAAAGAMDLLAQWLHAAEPEPLEDFVRTTTELVTSMSPRPL